MLASGGAIPVRIHDTSGDFVWNLEMHFFGISTLVHSIFTETHNNQVMSPTENCSCLHTHVRLYVPTCILIWTDVHIRVLYKQYANLTRMYVHTVYHAYVCIIIICMYVCMYMYVLYSYSLVQYTYVHSTFNICK